VAATEIVIGLRAQVRGSELVRQTSIGVVLGVMILAVEVLLH